MTATYDSQVIESLVLVPVHPGGAIAGPGIPIRKFAYLGNTRWVDKLQAGALPEIRREVRIAEPKPMLPVGRYAIEVVFRPGSVTPMLGLAGPSTYGAQQRALLVPLVVMDVDGVDLVGRCERNGELFAGVDVAAQWPRWLRKRDDIATGRSWSYSILLGV
jgi:hypothetical protein